jgi:hypothetical protein
LKELPSTAWESICGAFVRFPTGMTPATDPIAGWFVALAEVASSVAAAGSFAAEPPSFCFEHDAGIQARSRIIRIQGSSLALTHTSFNPSAVRLNHSTGASNFPAQDPFRTRRGQFIIPS